MTRDPPGDVTRFDLVAPFYDRLRLPASRRRLASALAHADREVDRVLDVGGGSGRGLRALDPPEGVVVDPSAGMLAEAARRGLAAVQGDGRALPVRDASVDAVLVLDALHHVADRDAVLREAARVLRPGGVLVVQEYDPTTVPGRALATAEHLVGFDSAFETPAETAARLRAAGLPSVVVERGFAYVVAGVKSGDPSRAPSKSEP
ncbi:MAG: class I SAM-dependent methyltransferase [Halorientalis sp.]